MGRSAVFNLNVDFTYRQARLVGDDNRRQGGDFRSNALFADRDWDVMKWNVNRNVYSCPIAMWYSICVAGIRKEHECCDPGQKQEEALTSHNYR
jgi:hypothetical protein